MKRFYGNCCYLSCGNDCSSHLQALIFDEAGNPIDTNWEELGRIYSEHNSKCSRLLPYKFDGNAFYGDPNDCYEYCEYEPRTPIAAPTISLKRER